MRFYSVMAAMSATVLIAGCAGMRSGSDAPVKVSEGTLVNSAGMTLYTLDRDTAGNGKSACNGQCIALWPALVAKGDDKPSGDYSVITRDDGTKQWAYKGKPLYTWTKDQRPGDRTGDGVNNVWHVARP